MAIAQAQYLRIYKDSVSYERWQSYYVNNTVLWQSAAWIYQPFEADGITSGRVEAETTIVVKVPATTSIVETVRRALENECLIELRIYEFDPELGNIYPQLTQELIASYTGEVVGAQGTFTSLSIELGSNLAPVGAQIPPRKYTTRLIGAPCRL